MDSHLAKIMGEMLLHMADHSHAYPGYGAFDTPEKWDAHLRDMSRRLLAWNDDTWCDNDAFETTKQAMIEFGQNYGFYWDLWITPPCGCQVGGTDLYFPTIPIGKVDGATGIPSI
jgi:hypothetical protein